MNTEPVAQQSLIVWLYQSLGFTFAALFFLSAIVCFILTLLLLLRGKGPMAVACLLLVIHWPVMVGILGAVTGIISSFEVIARSSTTPKPSELAEGLSLALVTVLIGSLMTMFFYIVGIIGTLLRSTESESPNKN